MYDRTGGADLNLAELKAEGVLKDYFPVHDGRSVRFLQV